VTYYTVGPGFFTVMRIPILGGRDFNAADPFGSTAIISERLAMKMYGSTSVIGRTFPIAALSAPAPGSILDDAAKANPNPTVIGVAADASFVQSDSGEPGVLYVPLNPKEQRLRALLVRSRSSAAGLVFVMRNAARNLNNSLVPDAHLLTEDFEMQRTGARMLSTVLAVLGGLALSITCIGIFGTVSYAATLRRQEIGIRMALGAAKSSMFLFLLKQLRWPLGAGLTFGLAVAIPTGQLFEIQLPVKGFDPLILVIVGAFVVLTAVAAALLPAWRAVRQAPLDSLRSE
jgi:putative ABC transport system permease protein